MINIFKNKKIRILVILSSLLLIVVYLKTLGSQKTALPDNLQKITPVPQATTIPINTPTLIPEKGDPDFYQQMRSEIENNYPLFDFVPYETENYRVNYTDDLTLKVTLKKDTPEIRQEVLDWISSKGINPKTHKIVWKNL